MKAWLEDKRPAYLDRLLQFKKGPKNSETDGKQNLAPCARCGTGRPVWRCLDCTDKTAVCLVCCKNTHKLELFHRIEKWNGRHYQQGALWQVGVKIFTGHNGSPCPRSIAALSSMQRKGTKPPLPGLAGSILAEVAAEIGTAESEVLWLISEALDQPITALGSTEQRILSLAAEKSGQTVLHLLDYLKQSIGHGAEDEAEELQTKSDNAAAEAEVDSPENQDAPNSAVPLDNDVGGDEDWEDEDERPIKGHLPRFLPRPPPTDGGGNKFITVMHTNGFHTLPMVWCACPDHLEDRDLQLLDLHLYPTSTDQINTVFTFSCLDDHRYEYLECKSSRYQYHNKMRRLTSPKYPAAAPNRYAELGRVSRQWRNLKYRKWFWLLDNSSAKRGTMALFCAACPQDGVNLPPDWISDYAKNP
jgi:hypothetical protein